MCKNHNIINTGKLQYDKNKNKSPCTARIFLSPPPCPRDSAQIDKNRNSYNIIIY